MENVGVLRNDPDNVVTEFRIGYALNPKKLRKPIVTCNQSPSISRKIKWAGGGLADLLAQPALGDNLTFYAWNPDIPPEQQPFFHIIIHKLTEDLDREDSKDKIEALENYLQYYKHTILLDPLSSVKKVISRFRTCTHLSHIEARLGTRVCPFRQPLHFFVEENESVDSIKEKLAACHMQMPIICKPVTACGTPRSHEMAVIVSEDDLHLLPRPCIVQQYEDHANVFYKVYVIDESVSVFRRSSLPDIASLLQQKDKHLKSLVFDSRHSYPSLSDFCASLSPLDDINSRVNNHSDQSVSSPNPSWKLQSSPLRSHKVDTNNVVRLETNTPKAGNYNINIINNADNLDNIISEETRLAMEASARFIAQEFNLRLFGFDVLLIPGKKITVVDVNYFPSYKEIEDFPEQLCALLARLAASVEANKDN